MLNACATNATTTTAGPNNSELATGTSPKSAVTLTPNVSPHSNEITTRPPALSTIAFLATSSPAGANNQAGCGQATPLKPATSQNQTLAVKAAGARGNATRSYRLHLPSSYQPTQPQAVLLVFHGHGGNAADMENVSGFSSLADQQDFIAVYPQGIADDYGLPMWASVGPAADYGIDDLSFVNDLLKQLQKQVCVDGRRIYATGFSNGGGMSHYLACKLTERIAAVVPIAGNYFPLPDGGCQPSRAVALLEIHGTADNVISYNGRPDKDYPGWPLPAMADYLAEWASRNGCGKGPQTFLDTSEIKGEEWSGCRDNSTVAHYQIKGGSHSYPAAIGSRSSQEVIWTFLASHRT